MKHILFGMIVAALLCEGSAVADEKKSGVPEVYNVKFETSCGDFVIEVHREWAPKGADRFHELVTKGFYDECRFFRVVPGFVVQFGMNGDPKVQAEWQDATIEDDTVTQSNTRGFVTFASRGPDTRTSQIFINFGDNSSLDRRGFFPFGKVVSGMEVVDKINAEYAQKPDQGQIAARGNEYLKEAFPKLDYVKKATILSGKDAEKK